MKYNKMSQMHKSAGVVCDEVTENTKESNINYLNEEILFEAKRENQVLIDEAMNLIQTESEKLILFFKENMVQCGETIRIVNQKYAKKLKKFDSLNIEYKQNIIKLNEKLLELAELMTFQYEEHLKFCYRTFEEMLPQIQDHKKRLIIKDNLVIISQLLAECPKVDECPETYNAYCKLSQQFGFKKGFKI